MLLLLGSRTVLPLIQSSAKLTAKNSEEGFVAEMKKAFAPAEDAYALAA